MRQLSSGLPLQQFLFVLIVRSNVRETGVSKSIAGVNINDFQLNPVLRRRGQIDGEQAILVDQGRGGLGAGIRSDFERFDPAVIGIDLGRFSVAIADQEPPEGWAAIDADRERFADTVPGGPLAPWVAGLPSVRFFGS